MIDSKVYLISGLMKIDPDYEQTFYVMGLKNKKEAEKFVLEKNIINKMSKNF